jgi:hypothetical protein
MSADQAITYLQALLASVTISVIVPLAMFVLMLGSFWYLLAKAQSKPDFHIEQIFLDETGKPSAVPMISLMAFAFSVWYLAVRALSGKPDPQEFLYFLIAWSGAVVMIELAKKWDGRLPWSKGPNA